jgi:type IV secretory pathway VirB2 component (pilin)
MSIYFTWAQPVISTTVGLAGKVSAVIAAIFLGIGWAFRPEWRLAGRLAIVGLVLSFVALMLIIVDRRFLTLP